MVISFPELNIRSAPLALKKIRGGLDEATWVSASFSIPNGVPELWYPHNLGTPKRYNVTIEVTPGDLSITKTTGFRTIVLHQEEYTKAEISQHGYTPGSKFQFSVNGRPFYASGSNVIPFDPFYARTSTEQVRGSFRSKGDTAYLHIFVGSVGARKCC